MYSDEIVKKSAEMIIKSTERLALNGIIIVEIKSMSAVYLNSAVKDIFAPDKIMEKMSVLDIFGSDDFLSDIEKISTIELMNDKTVMVAVYRDEEYLVINIYDYSKIAMLEEENKRLLLFNKQLRDVYEIYNYDTMCITDAKGIVEFSGEACERHCGITHEDIIGMSMYDLEREKVFYPSVTVKVIDSGKSEIIMQDTSIGVKLCTVGIPVFDEAGELHKVISISRDFSKEIEIAKEMIKIEKIIEKEPNSEKDCIVTCSSSVIELMQKMERAAVKNSTVLICGETGTGKTLFANYIHKVSNRSDKPFVSVNCGAIPENLIESELFGYEQGAFTGADKNGKAGLIEMAQGGTIFFDEIGELPLPQQVKLLHVLQEKALIRVGGRHSIKLDVRVIAATNKNLQEMVSKGEFREDLYYRLNVVSFNVPRLSERSEDIYLLTTHFMNKYNEENNDNKEITERAIQYLKKYDWPGNIRELENLIEMLCVVTPGDKIDIRNLPTKIFSGKIPSEAISSVVTVNGVVPFKEAIEEVEKQLIRNCMKEYGSNHRKIADFLEVDRSTITRKINAYGIKK